MLQEGFTSKDIYDLLEQIPDPEIPVISVVELGVIRDVIVDGKKVTIKITPTYSGCPAMHQMEKDIKQSLKHHGVENFTIETIYSPAWTTDWITNDALEKLRVYGIAPPHKTTEDKSFLFGKSKVVECPRCKSKHTELISQFGSTACKSLYKCNDCLEPFDYFKCI
jgi:ring-1,2-phenylacetyl-CoA epoxidase subunit PaaD